MVGTARDRLDYGLAIAAMAVALLSALPLGANRPAAWLALALFVLVLAIPRAVADLMRRADAAGSNLSGILVLWCAVIAWVLFQSTVPVPPPFAHPFWSAISDVPAYISADPIAGPHVALKLTTYGLLFWVVARGALYPDRAVFLLSLAGLFIAILSAYGIAARALNWNPILGDHNVGGVSATFINRNHFATYAAIGVVVNLALFLRATPRFGGRTGLRTYIERFFGGAWIFGLATLIAAAGVAMSQSRGGALAVAAGVLSLLWMRRGMGGSRAGTVLGVGIFLFTLIALGGATIGRLLSQGINMRLSIYQNAVASIADRPLLGHGPGAFQDGFRPFVSVDLATREIDYAHSSYLEAIHDLGLPMATLGFLAFALFLLRMARATAGRRRYRTVPQTALACAILVAVHASLDFSLQIPAVAALMACLLGLGWAQAFRPRASRAE